MQMSEEKAFQAAGAGWVRLYGRSMPRMFKKEPRASVAGIVRNEVREEAGWCWSQQWGRW